MEVNPNLTDKAMRDYQLVQAAINNGDQKAYAALMNNYRDSLYFMLLKMTNNPQSFIGVMTRLANQNLADADPPAWVKFLLHSHPSISKRVAMAQRFRVEE